MVMLRWAWTVHAAVPRIGAANPESADPSPNARTANAPVTRSHEYNACPEQPDYPGLRSADSVNFRRAPGTGHLSQLGANESDGLRGETDYRRRR
jgi:hypothetical protein